MFNLLQKTASYISIAANAAGTFVIIALIIIVNYDIVARGLFNKPFLGAVEVVQFSLVLIVFLQLPDVIRVGKLTRSDGFLELLANKKPFVGTFTRCIIDVIGVGFMLLVAIAIWPEFIEMWQSKDYFGVPGVFTAPWWPVKLVIFLCACLCTVHFIFHIIMRLQRDTIGSKNS